MTKRMACLVLLFCAAAISASAQTFTTLMSFDGTDGHFPGPLVQGFDGNLYGNTAEGGSNSRKPYGTTYKVTPTGTLTSLYSFCGRSNCTDGGQPAAGLALSTAGDFYGTTDFGGLNGQVGYGTVFKISPSGALTDLYDFCAQPDCEDGAGPTAGVLLAADGNFYGTTQRGGGDSSFGTIFKITPAGILTTLYSFASTGGANGFYPTGLTQATDGNFYGTTSGGALGYGTVFKMTPAGTLALLYSFCGQANCTDGSYPNAALVQASDGNFYGTTSQGGTNNYGTIFKITPAGMLTTLYSFCAQASCEDGAYPTAALIQADGNFYGTTSGQLATNLGTIFRFSQGSTLTTLHSFSGTDGELPYAGLLQATNGYLYGATADGGTSADGTVFSLSIGLSPFIETLLTSGKAGTSVPILGNNLTGTTSVAFNGIAATFTVVSDTEITVTVPSGATTGFVTVTTPSSTLKSNKPFHVVP
jgi:uncharacterized repeat protein (TIGR03803 family)